MAGLGYAVDNMLGVATAHGLWTRMSGRASSQQGSSGCSVPPPWSAVVAYRVRTAGRGLTKHTGIRALPSTRWFPFAVRSHLHPPRSFVSQEAGR